MAVTINYLVTEQLLFENCSLRFDYSLCLFTITTKHKFTVCAIGIIYMHCAIVLFF